MNSQGRINFVEVVGIVLRVGGVEVAVERGSLDGTEDAAAKRDIAGCARGNSVGPADAIDEIVPISEVFTLSFNSIAESWPLKRAIHFDFRVGGGDFALREQHGFGVFHIIENNVRGDGDDSGRESGEGDQRISPLVRKCLKFAVQEFAESTSIEPSQWSVSTGKSVLFTAVKASARLA